MAELTHFSDEITTAYYSATEAWEDVLTIPAASLSANTKYLIIWQATFAGGNVNSSNYRLRAADNGTGTPTSSVFDALGREMEPTQSDGTSAVGIGCMWVRSYTTPSTPTDIDLQAFGTSGYDRWVDQGTLTMIDLDELGSSNYVEAQTSAATGYTTTPAAVLSLSALAADEEWLILGYNSTAVASITTNCLIRLYTDPDYGGSLQIVANNEYEGEDTTEQIFTGLMGVHYSSSGSLQPYIEVSTDSGTGYSNLDSYLIAIKTSAFADFNYQFSTTSQADLPDETSGPSTLETIASYTPTTAGNHLLMGSVNYTVADDTMRFGTEITVGGTSARPGDIAQWQTQESDATAAEQSLNFIRESISGTNDILFRAVADATEAAGSLEYSFLGVLNLNLAAAGSTYDETGRATTITGTTTLTDAQGYAELLRATTGTITTAVTDVQAYVDLLLASTVTATTTITDIQNYVDGLATTITATINIADSISYKELLRAITATATTNVSDVQGYAELLRAVAIAATTNVSDVQDYVDLLATSVAATITVTDVYTGAGGSYDETGRAVTINATIGITDLVRIFETLLATTVAATTTVTDRQDYVDTLATVITSTQTILDILGFHESNLATTITATVDMTDAQAYADLLATIITSASTVTDVQAYVDLLATAIVSFMTVRDIYTPVAGDPVFPSKSVQRAGRVTDTGIRTAERLARS